MNGWKNRQIDRRTDGRMDGQEDRYMDGWKNRWMDRWKNGYGWMDRHWGHLGIVKQQDVSSYFLWQLQDSREDGDEAEGYAGKGKTGTFQVH